MRGAFIDPNGVRFDPNNGEVEGWLYKQSAWLRDWRRRYFVLSGTKLFFAKDDSSTPHGMIDLSDCSPKRSYGDRDPISTADDEVGREFAIEIVTRDTTYFLLASNHVEKENWMTAMRKAVDHGSRLLTNEEELDGSEIAFH